MTNQTGSRILHPDNIAGVVLIAVAAWLLTKVTDMPYMSALLPVAMLCTIIGLSALMILRNLIKSGAVSVNPVFTSLPRFALVVACVAGYVISVANAGFYTSTLLMLPVVSWLFGYRKLKGIALATLIFVGGIALIFLVLMNQSLPPEFFQS
ncbi:hypothetical protein TH25_12470 [Thalassospira profundimaris]|uniref:DUF1468 domain-containing protein n=1 Tax=Thalassospira profundimaris TaxID=502049 RepID=A0A367XAN7_9PROT|nr:tripartite tricarboxylate transporter TctB family protein [Thalassospira profundimaris]RCK49831.1 hypothetical protein TH25_12470 [Thalassospira profundimaris]